MSKNNQKPKKFRAIWATQTELGGKYGLSAIAVGKILKTAGLKDVATGDATPRAIEEGFAINTPLKDGRSFFLWSVEKAGGLIAAGHKPLSPVEHHVREVKATLRDAEKAFAAGDDKLACLLLDLAYDAVPEALRDAVQALAEPPEAAAKDAPPVSIPILANSAIRAPWEE